MNKVNILFFATLKEYMGTKTLQMEIPASTTVGQLKDMLAQKNPRLGRMRDTIMAAIDREYAGDDQLIPAQAEIAFFPPVSGG